MASLLKGVMVSFGEVKIIVLNELKENEINPIRFLVKYNDKTIALKNVPFKYGLSATRELRNYGDLDAVKNSGSERFGIPNIIYSGETKDERYYLLGMRLLNPIHTRFNVDCQFVT